MSTFLRVSAAVVGLTLFGACVPQDAGPVSGATPVVAPERAAATQLRLAFGSCADDDKPDHRIWQSLASAAPDALVMLGDNVYADGPMALDEARLRSEYARLGATPGFVALRERIPVFATWDDHDYGLNDGGADFPLAAVAERVFLDFWGFAADDPARQRPGIYHQRRLQAGQLNIQLLLLDTRRFRGPLREAPLNSRCSIRHYTGNPGAELLGAAQWHWLAAALQEPADLRVLVTSIQLLPTEHCWEKWANFPDERQRLLDLLGGVSNLLVLSGDRHLGEISQLDAVLQGGQPLVEATSSPLSARSGFGAGEANALRVSSDNLRESQFGLLDIDAEGVTVALVDVAGRVRQQHRLVLVDAP